MFHRSPAVAVAVAIAWGSVGGVALAAPVAAAEVSASSSPTSPVTEAPQNVSGTETQENSNSSAEESGVDVTPLIMVAGLAMLCGAIFMVVRSGSSRRTSTLD
jgi:hypothetical protein